MVIVPIHEHCKSFVIQVKLHKSTSKSCFPIGIRQSYNARFKLMIINYAKKMNNGNAARKYMNVLYS